MLAVVWMLGALASFSLMAVGARELSGELPVFQSLFFRSVIGLIAISLVVLLSGRRQGLSTQRPGLHTLRNVFHFGGQYGWFVGIGLLPLAEVFALEFTVPMWTMLIAAVTLGERINGRKLLSIGLGLVGVLIIVQPGLAVVNTASLIVIASAICYSASHTATKALSRSEPALTILFYMCLIQLPIGGILALPQWQWPVGSQWGWLLVIGLMALSAHFCMAKAMAHAEVSTVVTLDFLRLPLIALIGVVFYAEPFEVAILLGGVLMMTGNMLNIAASRRR